MHVKLYNGPCADGYIRARHEAYVWGIYCSQCLFIDIGQDEPEPMRVHEIQHPFPGPAMDWARMHEWQHNGAKRMVGAH